AEDARPLIARLLRPPQRLQPVGIRCAFARRVRAPLAAVPLVELVHAFGVAKVTTFADFLAADPRVEGVVAPLDQLFLPTALCAPYRRPSSFARNAGGEMAVGDRLRCCHGRSALINGHPWGTMRGESAMYGLSTAAWSNPNRGANIQLCMS